MKTFAKNIPKGDPNEIPSICFYVLTLNDAVFVHASFNNFPLLVLLS